MSKGAIRKILMDYQLILIFAVFFIFFFFAGLFRARKTVADPEAVFKGIVAESTIIESGGFLQYSFDGKQYIRFNVDNNKVFIVDSDLLDKYNTSPIDGFTPDIVDVSNECFLAMAAAGLSSQNLLGFILEGPTKVKVKQSKAKKVMVAILGAVSGYSLGYGLGLKVFKEDLALALARLLRSPKQETYLMRYERMVFYRKFMKVGGAYKYEGDNPIADKTLREFEEKKDYCRGKAGDTSYDFTSKDFNILIELEDFTRDRRKAVKAADD